MERGPTTQDAAHLAAFDACRERLDAVTYRAETSRRFAAALRLDILEILKELWPLDRRVADADYHSIVRLDIERMPSDLLHAVSDRLFRLAGLSANEDAVRSGAAELVAGWLCCRWLELNGPTAHRPQIEREKLAHSRYICDLLHQRSDAHRTLNMK
jgi:hypothetical protein